MFRSNLATYPYVSPVNTYGHNLGRATRGFLAALFAFDPVETSEDSASLSVDGNVETIEELNELATQFDTLMPNQAAELRYLAGTSESTQDELE